mmetsp:Transcript_5088/g.19679  ORF Transcript_5088/g.19679 Transcript_5088/m.19679 type:complete len:519 (+) Transcript_5088:15-1571(+)
MMLGHIDNGLIEQLFLVRETRYRPPKCLLSNDFRDGSGFLPVHSRKNESLVDTILVGDDLLQQTLQEFAAHRDWLEAEILKLGVLGVVVVLLHLCARVGHGDDLRIQSNLLTGFRDHSSEFVHGELLRELVINLHLARRRGVVARDLNAAHGVSDVQETAGLATLTVHGHRVTDGRLDAEAVERGTEDGVVVEAVHQVRVHVGFIRGETVDDALVQVGGANAPRLGAEQHVRGVVALGQVIERTTLLRVRQRVGAAVVGDGDVTFFDVDIRGAVFAHRAELDAVAFRGEFLDGVQHVDGTHDVVRLREHGAGAVHHGVRRGALLTEVNARRRRKLFESGAQEFVVADVADEEVDVAAADFLPLAHALVDTLDRRQRVETELVVHRTTAQVVDDGDRVAALGQVQRRRPAAVAVAADDHNALTLARIFSVRVRAVRRRDGDRTTHARRARVRESRAVRALAQRVGSEGSTTGAQRRTVRRASRGGARIRSLRRARGVEHHRSRARESHRAHRRVISREL